MTDKWLLTSIKQSIKVNFKLQKANLNINWIVSRYYWRHEIESIIMKG